MLVMWPGPAVTQAPPARFDLIVPPRFRLNEWDVGAISPDGRRFVFTAQVDGPLRHLVLRDLNSTEMVVMPDTEDPWRPFWSPDSQSVAFIAGNTGQLRMVRVTGGPARMLAETGRYGRRHVGARRHPVRARRKKRRAHLSRRGYGRAG